jgi:hypothetical protein
MSVALVIQRATCMLSIICSLSGCIAFSTLSHKQHNLREKKFSNIKGVFLFSLQLSSETFLIPRRPERDMYLGFHVEYALFLDFN